MVYLPELWRSAPYLIKLGKTRLVKALSIVYLQSFTHWHHMTTDNVNAGAILYYYSYHNVTHKHYCHTWQPQNKVPNGGRGIKIRNKSATPSKTCFVLSHPYYRVAKKPGLFKKGEPVGFYWVFWLKPRFCKRPSWWVLGFLWVFSY